MILRTLRQISFCGDGRSARYSLTARSTNVVSLDNRRVLAHRDVIFDYRDQL